MNSSQSHLDLPYLAAYFEIYSNLNVPKIEIKVDSKDCGESRKMPVVRCGRNSRKVHGIRGESESRRQPVRTSSKSFVRSNKLELVRRRGASMSITYREIDILAGKKAGILSRRKKASLTVSSFRL